MLFIFFHVFQIKKTKNVSHDPFGSKLGRIHMTKQDLGQLQTRKMKGLKKGAPQSGDESEEGPSEEKRVRTDESMDVGEESD